MLKASFKNWHLNHTHNLKSKIWVAKDLSTVLDDMREVRNLEKDEVYELYQLILWLFPNYMIVCSGKKSRINWLKEGDANSNFFSTVLCSLRQRSKAIISLFVEDAQIEEVDRVQQAILHHFQNHFKRVPHVKHVIRELSFNSISDVDGGDLIKPFILEEIKEAAVWNCDNFKCPGQDGINLVTSKIFRIR